MKTIEETIKKVEEVLKSYEEFISDPVGNVRYGRLVILKEFLLANGFPKTFEEKVKCSLVPYIFQEANYDSLDWTSQNAKLDQLEGLFETDFLVQNKGEEKKEVSGEEFEKYVDEALDIIDSTQKEAKVEKDKLIEKVMKEFKELPKDDQIEIIINDFVHPRVELVQENLNLPISIGDIAKSFNATEEDIRNYIKEKDIKFYPDFADSADGDYTINENGNVISFHQEHGARFRQTTLGSYDGIAEEKTKYIVATYEELKAGQSESGII